MENQVSNCSEGIQVHAQSQHRHKNEVDLSSELRDLAGCVFRLGPSGKPLLVLQASIKNNQIAMQVRDDSGKVDSQEIPLEPGLLSSSRLRVDNFFQAVDRCPLCLNSSGLSQVRFKATQLFWDIPVVECFNCGLLYKRSFPTGYLFERIYSSDYLGLKVGENADQSVRMLASRVSRLGRPRGRHLDYGCGTGYFVDAALMAGWDSFGCDPYLPDSRLRSPNDKRFFKLDVTQGTSFSKLGTFDCISLWAVIEHMPNLGQALAVLTGMLRPGGALVFNSPNGRSLVARKSGRNWILSTLLEHVVFMSPQAVRWFAHKHDLVVKKFRISGSPYPLGTGGKGLSEQGFQEFPFLYPALSAEQKDAAVQEPIKDRPISVPLISGLTSLALEGGGKGWLASLLRSAVHLTRIGDHIEVTLVKES